LSLHDAQHKIEAWRHSYNKARPRSALAWLSNVSSWPDLGRRGQLW